MKRFPRLLTACLLLSAGALNIAGSEASAAVLTIQDCAGTQVASIPNPTVNTLLYTLPAPADCGSFQYWEVTGPASLVDTLVPSVRLLTALTEDATIRARCSGAPTLTVLDCGGSPVGNSPYTCPQLGIIVTFSPPAGFEFKDWKKVEGDVNADLANNPLILFSPMVVNATLQAECLALPKLTVIGGTATTPERQAGGYYLPDQVVSISATIPSGMTFAGWASSPAGAQFGNASQADTTVTVTQTMTVRATFSGGPGPTLRKLTVINGTAATQPDQAPNLYNDGAVVQIAATVPADKDFTGWTANITNPVFGNTSQRNTTIKMTADITVTAHLQDKNQPLPPDGRSGHGCRNADGVYEAVPQDLNGEILGGLRVTNAAVGQCFDWSVTENDMSAADAPGPDPGTFEGFQGQNAYGRTFAISAVPDTAGFKALVSIRLTGTELAIHSVSASNLVLFRLDTTTPVAKWVAAGTNLGAVIPTDSVGDAGRTLATDGSVTFWAVVDQLGTFAVGQPAAALPPPDDGGTQEEPGQTTPDDTGQEQPPVEVPACGACGMGAGPAALFCTLTWSIAHLFSARRRRRG